MGAISQAYSPRCDWVSLLMRLNLSFDWSKSYQRPVWATMGVMTWTSTREGRPPGPTPFSMAPGRMGRNCGEKFLERFLDHDIGRALFGQADPGVGRLRLWGLILNKAHRLVLGGEHSGRGSLRLGLSLLLGTKIRGSLRSPWSKILTGAPLDLELDPFIYSSSNMEYIGRVTNRGKIQPNLLPCKGLGESFP